MVLQRDGNELSMTNAMMICLTSNERCSEHAYHRERQVVTILPCGTTRRTVDEERIAVFRLAQNGLPA